MTSIRTATVAELTARINELEQWEVDNALTAGSAKFPIHDEISGDDPYAGWNNTGLLEREIVKRNMFRKAALRETVSA